MASAICPDCGRMVNLGPKPRKGQWITCPHCNADLEIVSTNPVELDWANLIDEEGEDYWDDEEEFWDDEEDDEDDEDWEDDDEF